MVKNLALLLLGFVAGIVFIFIVLPKGKEEYESEKIDQPLIIRDERLISIATAVFEVPFEKLARPASRKWYEEQMKWQLANQIWRFALVEIADDEKNLMRMYRAKIMVVDNGRKNPFLDMEERGDGK